MRCSLGALVVGFALAACKGEAEEVVCEDLCTELMQTCAYDAFPDRDSCLQGCLFDQEQGVDVDALLDCVVGAECDTPAILECEHEFGGDTPGR